MDADELQAGGAGAERAEDHGRGGGAEGSSAAHQRDRDAVETVPGPEDARVLVLRSKDEKGAAESGQRAGEGHALADPAAGGNSARASGLPARPHGPPFEAPPGARQQPPDSGSREQCERKPEVEPAAGEEAGQPRGGGDRFGPGYADRRAGSRRAEGSGNEPFLHEVNGDPVEQNRADDLVNAAAHLEPPGQQSPQRAGEGRGGKAPDHRSWDVRLSDDCGGQSAPDQLALGADVEQSDGEGDRNR